MRKALGKMTERKLLERIVNTFLDIAAGDLAQLEPVRDVVVHRLVWPQRIRLKDEPEVTAFGGNVDAVRAFENDFVADLDRAFVRYFEAGHRAEQGRLAAARRTEQRHDLAAVQRQRD